MNPFLNGEITIFLIETSKLENFFDHVFSISPKMQVSVKPLYFYGLKYTCANISLVADLPIEISGKKFGPVLVFNIDNIHLIASYFTTPS
jgi:hypothetical protein